MGSADSLISSGTENPIVLFDGVCNLCNGAVLFIIKRDHKNKFRFASLQSSTGMGYLRLYSINEPDLYSVILIKSGNIYDRSDAVLEISRDLSGLWPILYWLKVIPAFIRNAVYKLVAKNRYRFFGRKDQCMLPTPELKARFLE